MKTNQAGIKLLHDFESCQRKLSDGRIQAYKCPAGVWTIGWGNTFFEDGTPVKEGDVITQARADSLFKFILSKFEDQVDKLVTSKVNENQFSALVSFAYNAGVANLRSSTLLKKVNTNPLDPTIANEFAKWNKAAGKVLNGLTRRREAESKLYFS